MTNMVAFVILGLITWTTKSVLVGGQQPVKISEGVSILQEKIKDIADDVLGADEIQKIFDGAGFSRTSVDGQALLDKLENSIRINVQEKIEVVRELKKVIEANYRDFTSTTVHPKCCEAQPAEYSPSFKGKVDFSKVCVATSKDGKPPYKFPTDAVLNKMIENKNRYPSLKWQYYGTEEGVMYNYPSYHLTNPPCGEYDPRYRPFYVDAATTKAKDLVLVIDTSGSMSSNNRINIAIDAAETVLSTLNPKDKIGIVSFSSEAHTPQGTFDTSTCYSSKLASATPTNIAYLRTYINALRADGGTKYVRALKKAFMLLQSVKQTEDRVPVILFLSDGEPTDTNNRSLLLEEVSKLNAPMNNRVIIHTFGFGSDLKQSAQELLRTLAAQCLPGARCGDITAGNFHHVSDGENLRYKMASYYNAFSYPSDSTEVTITVPYVDLFGTGLLSSICLPVYHGTPLALAGVTCADVSMSDLLQDVTYFNEGENSYAFLINGRGQAYMHPLLPRPFEVHSDPIFLDISVLERDGEALEVIDSMKNGGNGIKTFKSKHVFPRGNSFTRGINSKELETTYHWKLITPLKVKGTNLSVCIAIANQDESVSLTSEGYTAKFLYHKLDILDDPPPMCKHVNNIATKEQSTVMLSRRAFKEAYKYLDQTETILDIEQYINYMNGILDQQGNIKDLVREMVLATGQIEDTWKNNLHKISSKVLWRYIGTSNGVFRMYPGATYGKEYDPTIRPWYEQAVCHRGSTIVTVPYTDAGGAGTISTIATTIYQGLSGGAHQLSDNIAGVVGADVSFGYLHELVIEAFPQCAETSCDTPSSVSCFLVDSNGYVVYHSKFLNRKLQVLHIVGMEPAVAARLISDGYMYQEGCINFKGLKRQFTWKLDLKTSLDTYWLKLKYIPDTNIFMGIKTADGDSSNCFCPPLEPDKTKCRSDDPKQCQCPCYTDLGNTYDYCNNSFQLSSDDFWSCTPNAPDKTPTDPLKEIEKEKREKLMSQLADCFLPNCDQYQDCKSCGSAYQCGWCDGTCQPSTVCSPNTQTISDMTKTQTNSDTTSEGLSTGAIVGIIVAILVILIAAVVAGIYLWRRSTEKPEASTESRQDNSHANPAFGEAYPTAPSAERDYPHNQDFPPPYSP